MPPKAIEISQSQAKSAGAAIANGTDKVKIGDSPYYLEKSGASGLKLQWMEEELGTVKSGIDGSTAKVEEINIHLLFQRQRLGCLLAACLIGFCEAKGATSMRLGTPDTSAGFWKSGLRWAR